MRPSKCSATPHSVDNTILSSPIQSSRVRTASIAKDSRAALDLRKRCFNFILQNFGDVIGTPGFTELPQQILREVLSEASTRDVRLGSSPYSCG